ncbi:hypothetical protein FRB95_006612 [Tulasnella sp. JGI-2019a]|nr:hypothetical protein FRB95_006612 [Tulasnella sp. JGI-2019a]
MAVEFIVAFEVYFNDMPVLILELKRPGDIIWYSRRETADQQIRERLGDLREMCPIPTLHAISAFGTAICFYSINTKVQRPVITSHGIPRDRIVSNDTAPRDRWNYDVLEADGEARVRELVDSIRAACAAIVSQ